MRALVKGKDVLNVDIGGAKVGVDRVSNNGVPGNARLEYLSDPDDLVYSQGELKLTDFNDKLCSGTFTATGSNVQGAKFSVEGSFTRMPIRNV